MVPRLPGVTVKQETRELVLDLAENLYPGVAKIGELDKQNRSYWLLLAGGILREYPDISHHLETLGNVLARGVNAEIDDILQRLEADLEEKQRRSEAEERARGNQERREEERWQLEKEERRQRLEKESNREDNGFLIERALLVMMVVAFVLAAAGSSGTIALLSLVMLMLYRVMPRKKKEKPS